MRNSIFIITLAALVAAAFGCRREAVFTVSGSISGADSVPVVLEQSANGNWLVVDTLKIGDGGAYTISAPAPQFPAIYRLRRTDDGQQICFPVDSIDRLTVNTAWAAFAPDADVSGTDGAAEMSALDHQAMRFAVADTANADFNAWKNSVSQRIAANPGSIVAYYAINKWVGGQPLYDPANPADLRIIGAVANHFNEYRKDDPRTAYLVNLMLQAQKARRLAAAAAKPQVALEETSLLPISLQDYKGVTHDLGEVAAAHRLVLLNFTAYEAPFSPALNKVINDIYAKHHAAGFEVYQVSVDDDNVLWRQAAQNLPWITVYDAAGTASRNISSYAVEAIPTSFIIVNGDIVQRVDDATQLEPALRRYL